MVEYTLNLDLTFQSLADGTRRDILRLVAKRELSISEIAAHYDVTFAAISKHIKVLERAKLIVKRRSGKEQLVRVQPLAIKQANDYLEAYRQMWESRYGALDEVLKQMK